MRGWLLTFVPESSFKLVSGADNLTKYHFNKNAIDHLFCQTCGTASYGSGGDGSGNVMMAINVRCLDDVDVSTLKINEVNGKEL